MPNAVCSTPVETKDYGNGHVVRYYMLGGEMRVEETRNGHRLDTTLTEFLMGDPVEREKYFGLGPQYSILASGPTNLGSP